MQGFKGFISNKTVTVVLFLVAIALLALSGIGGARAALTYFSDTHTTHVEMQNIGVTLLENDQRVAWRDYISDDNWDETNAQLPDNDVFAAENSNVDYVYRGKTGQLLGSMLASGEQLQYGHKYPEKLAVQNTGSISQYVRVTVEKYWLEPSDGGNKSNKRTDVSPVLIDLNFVNIGNSWLIDNASSGNGASANPYAERTVLYHASALAPGQTSVPFTDTVSIDGNVAQKVTQSETNNGDGTKTITTSYDYDGLIFCVEAQVEAIQDHNAADAAKSAWGVDVNINSDGKLSLV